MAASFEVPFGSRAKIRALEVPYECFDQVMPVVNLVRGKVLKPGSSRVRQVQRQVADNHGVVRGASQLAGETIVVQPNLEIHVPCVLRK